METKVRTIGIPRKCKEKAQIKVQWRENKQKKVTKKEKEKKKAKEKSRIREEISTTLPKNRIGSKDG